MKSGFSSCGIQKKYEELLVSTNIPHRILLQPSYPKPFLLTCTSQSSHHLGIPTNKVQNKPIRLIGTFVARCMPYPIQQLDLQIVHIFLRDLDTLLRQRMCIFSTLYQQRRYCFDFPLPTPRIHRSCEYQFTDIWRLHQETTHPCDFGCGWNFCRVQHT